MKTKRQTCKQANKSFDRQEKEITNNLGMKFVLIPAGEFAMGSPFQCYARPHRVTITRLFYIQTTMVTQAQWKKVMGNNPSYNNVIDTQIKELELWWNYWKHIERKGNDWNLDDLPVENVSWFDVQEFIEKLNCLEGAENYRLPTEAEWEYSCRAGSTTTWHFGNDSSIMKKYGGDNYLTTPVGRKKPNDWGLYDMHGECWEWVEDWYGPFQSNSVTDPSGPPTGEFRIARGGSWSNEVGNSSSAARWKRLPNDKDRFLGLRLVRNFSVS